jgi:hypothetical protein
MVVRADQPAAAIWPPKALHAKSAQCNNNP